jgi:hypothetical protein
MCVPRSCVVTSHRPHPWAILLGATCMSTARLPESRPAGRGRMDLTKGAAS